MRILLLLIALTVLATPAFSRDNPLEPFAKLIGGIWVSEEGIKDPEGAYVKTQAEWGFNKRTIRSRVWQVSNRVQRLIMEGGIYWHPGRKEAVMWAVDETGNVMEGVYSMDGEVMLSKWAFFTPRQKAEGENRSTYPDKDSMVTEEYFNVSGELRHARTRRMVRKEADWGDTGAATAAAEKTGASPQTPAELRLLERHMGGIWVGADKDAEPQGDVTFYRMSWGVWRRVAHIHTLERKAGKVEPNFEGAHFWHPSRNEVVFFQVSRDGTVFEGVSSVNDGKQVAEWTAYVEDREAKVKQTVRFMDDDTFETEISMKLGDDDWKEAISARFLRKQEGWLKPAAD